MKLRLLPSALLLALAAMVTQTVARADDAEKVVVISCGDNLKFDVTKIEAVPGEKIHVKLTNNGTMPKATMGHNWILLDSMSQVNPYATAAMSAAASAYQPKTLATHVLAVIPLLGPKESGEVTFTAPAKPGKYPYICSVSGHAMAGMRGELTVK
ncbi:MAG: cupredoxin domain-containing protein [Verrucomicrobia bacterium]|nr:cupredoxin domain-containing protein [Verrucomicrobiota bacterium]